MTALDVVRRFIAAINAHDVPRIAALMTEDHRFVDSLGVVVVGAQQMRTGWEAYFRMVPDYRIDVRETYGDGPVVVALGSAQGTYTPDGIFRAENAWSTSAAWRAVVRDNRVAEWQVYADNEPIRQRIAAGTAGRWWSPSVERRLTPARPPPATSSTTLRRQDDDRFGARLRAVHERAAPAFGRQRPARAARRRHAGT